MAKNIEMNVLNESGQYETLWPNVSASSIVDFSGDNPLLSDSVKSLFGLTTSDVPNDVLEILSKAVIGEVNNSYAYTEKTIDLNTVSPGDIVNLIENDKEVPYIVGSINYEPELNGTGKVLLHRQNYYQNNSAWGRYNSYLGSNLVQDLTLGFFPKLNETIQNALVNTTIRYTPGNGKYTLSTTQQKIFVLSATEYGVTDSSNTSNVEGSVLPVANTLANLNGDSKATRTPSWEDGNRCVISFSDSSWAGPYDLNNLPSFTVFPCVVLDNSFKMTYYVDDVGTVHYEQEGTQESSFYTVLNEEIKMFRPEYGTYKGTGNYGSRYPNSLTFSGVPVLLIIIDATSYSSWERLIWLYGATFAEGNDQYFSITVNQAGSNISWYASNPSYGDAPTQRNESGVTYYYLALVQG